MIANLPVRRLILAAAVTMMTLVGFAAVAGAAAGDVPFVELGVLGDDSEPDPASGQNASPLTSDRQDAEASIARACPPESVPDSGFDDTAGSIHEAAIDCIAWYEVTRGLTRGSYGPAELVTRGQMASAVARDLSQATELPQPSPQGFADVAGTMHEARVLQVAELDVMQGTTPETFSPRRPVSRAQTAAALVAAYEHVSGRALPTGEDRFADDENSPHEEDINKAAEAGLVTGSGEDTFGPSTPIRRDQMAATLARVLDRFVANEHMTAEPAPVSEPEPPAREQASEASASAPDPDGQQQGVVETFEGVASWYGDGFAGQTTACGDRFDPDALTAAHRSLPCGTHVRVTNLANGATTTVRINDRGPHAAQRVLDVSEHAAEELGFKGAGETRVRGEVLED